MCVKFKKLIKTQKGMINLLFLSSLEVFVKTYEDAIQDAKEQSWRTQGCVRKANLTGCLYAADSVMGFLYGINV